MSVTAHGSIHSAVGADAIVFADAVSGGEHTGEAGLALVRQLTAAGASAPIVFAGAAQRELMVRCIRELHLPSTRIIGSAPAALASAMRALSAVVLDASAVEVVAQRRGRATRQNGRGVAGGVRFRGSRSRRSWAPHEIAALTARLPGLWPPGPYALASAAARVVEAVCAGSRRQYLVFRAMSGRGRIAAMPVELSSRRPRAHRRTVAHPRRSATALRQLRSKRD